MTDVVRTEDKVSLSVRVTTEEMDLVRRVADQNCRTVSDQLRYMIRGIRDEAQE